MGSSIQDWFDSWQRARVRRAYTAISGHRSASSGVSGMVEEMRWGLDHLSEDARDAADDRVLSTIFFGRPGLATLRRLASRRPELTARLLSRGAPWVLRWLVGGIQPTGPAEDYLPRCEFRRAGGEALCQRVCREPTERFTRERGFPVLLSPDPASHACRWTWLGSERHAR